MFSKVPKCCYQRWVRCGPYVYHDVDIICRESIFEGRSCGYPRCKTPINESLHSSLRQGRYSGGRKKGIEPEDQCDQRHVKGDLGIDFRCPVGIFQVQISEVGKTPRSEDFAISIKGRVGSEERPMADEPVRIPTSYAESSDRGGEHAQDLCGVSGAICVHREGDILYMFERCKSGKCLIVHCIKVSDELNLDTQCGKARKKSNDLRLEIILEFCRISLLDKVINVLQREMQSGAPIRYGWVSGQPKETNRKTRRLDDYGNTG